MARKTQTKTADKTQASSKNPNELVPMKLEITEELYAAFEEIGWRAGRSVAEVAAIYLEVGLAELNGKQDEVQRLLAFLNPPLPRFNGKRRLVN